MSGIDLVNAISGKFLLGLSNFASEAGVSAPSGNSQAARLQTGLRVGARSFAKVMEGLNSVTNVLNIAQASLEKIDTIVDKMIGLAEKASKSSISNTTRNRYNAEFSALVTDFREVLGKAELDDRDILTTDGLKEIFTLIGLDEEQSDSIAQVFKQFVTTDEDTELASEEVKGSRPVVVPVGSATASGTSTRDLQQVSNSTTGGGITTGVITRENSIYSDNEDFNNQNPNLVDSVAYVAPNGDMTATRAAPTSDVVVKNVSERSGYSVIVSNEDFLGYNSGHYHQLFLTDESGKVIHQYTDYLADVPPAQWGEADISADGLRAVLVISDGATDYLMVSSTITTIGAAPTGMVPYYSGPAATTEFSHITQNEEGTYFAGRYQDTVGGVDTIAMVEWGTGNFDLSLFTGYNNAGIDSLGFVGEYTLGLYQSGFGPGMYTWGGGTVVGIGDVTYPYLLAVEPIHPGHFTAYQGSAEGLGAMAIYGDLGSTGRDRVTLFNELDGSGGGRTEDYAYSPDGGDVISQISLAYNSDVGNYDIGITGVLSAYGDSDQELYRLTTVPHRAALGSAKSAEVDSLFTGDNANIRTRPNAYRTLNDLKALKKQIGDNEKAIDFALNTMRKNVQLTREAGLAFLEIADQITSESKAEDVARRLHTEILGNASAALSQAENLEPLVLAALNRLSAGS